MVVGGLSYHILIVSQQNCARIGWGKWIPAWLLESVASEIQAKSKEVMHERKNIIPNKKYMPYIRRALSKTVLFCLAKRENTQ